MLAEFRAWLPYSCHNFKRHTHYTILCFLNLKLSVNFVFFVDAYGSFVTLLSIRIVNINIVINQVSVSVLFPQHTSNNHATCILRRFNSTYVTIRITTRFHSMLDNAMVKINGYSPIRQARKIHGGGVTLYIRSTFRFTLLAILDTTTESKPEMIEYIIGILNMIGNDNPIFISLSYRSPDVSLSKNPHFAHQLKQHAGEYSTKIIMDDLNAKDP